MSFCQTGNHYRPIKTLVSERVALSTSIESRVAVTQEIGCVHCSATCPKDDRETDGHLERPSAPVFVRANHHSLELQWEHLLEQDEKRPEEKRLFDEVGAPRTGSLIYVQRREKRNGAIWESVYTGSALTCKLDQLKANTSYEFRIQYKISSAGVERSDWSTSLHASTTPEPMTGDTIFKAIAVPGKEQLEKLIQILGDNHRLLEHPDKDGNLPLMHACAKLDVGKVELLIQAGADVNNTIGSGKTALTVAASTGSQKICSLLLENGANLDAIDRNGMSILHHAIDSKNFETIAVIVRQLEKDKVKEMNREIGLHRWTPLYRAVMHDCNKEIIELLLNHGADVECEDKTTGTTALQLAVIRGNLITVQILVQHGADTKILSKNGGKSLRQLAMSTNKTDLINYVDTLPNSGKNLY